MPIDKEVISSDRKIDSENTTIQAMESVLKQKEEQYVHNVLKLLNEANAIQNKNLSEISLAQGMIQEAKIFFSWGVDKKSLLCSSVFLKK